MDPDRDLGYQFIDDPDRCIYGNPEEIQTQLIGGIKDHDLPCSLSDCRKNGMGRDGHLYSNDILQLESERGICC